MNFNRSLKRFFLISCVAAVSHSSAAADGTGPNDFDFEFGRWRTHLSRLTNPPKGPSTWTEYDGTTIVRQVWDGRANVEEIVVDGSTGRLEVLSLRLYNPAAREWSLNVATSRSGSLGVPVIGRFKHGRGEFFTDETVDGRPIMTRFIISDISAASFRFEGASSSDGGKTWELNLTATFTRIKDEQK